MSMLFAMFLFSLSMSATPGPVNLITLSSGVNYGFKNTLPFVSGATIGFVLLLLSIGLGLNLFTETYPELLAVFKYLGSLFIAYLALSLILADGNLVIEKGKQPSFTQGFILQWLNPKAWMACIAGVAAFNPQNSPSTLFVFVSIYFLVCYCCIALWAFTGERISHYLTEQENLLIFNRIMGGVLLSVAFYLAFLQ